MADKVEHVETVWDCSDCLLEKIRGRLRRCPRCLQPRNELLTPSEEDYIPEDAVWSSDAELARAATQGADVTCGSCGHRSDHDAEFCQNEDCGKKIDGDDIFSIVTQYDDSAPPSDADDIRLRATEAWLDKLAPLNDGPVTPDVIRARSSQVHDRPPSQYGSADDDDTSEPSGNYVLLTRRREQSGFSLFDVFAPYKRAILIILASLVGAGAIFGVGSYVYVNFIATHTVDVTVSSLSWKRQVQVEELRTLTQGGWRADLPSDARIIDRETRQHGTKKVFDRWHYWDETKYREVPDGTKPVESCTTTTTKNGNGTATKTKTCTTRNVPKTKREPYIVHHKDPVYRDEPVYDTWYTYQIDRWQMDHYNEASGDETVTPYWPKHVLHNTKQRPGSAKYNVESYYVVVTSDGKNYEFAAPDQAAWSRIEKGMTLQGEAIRDGTVVSLHWV